MSRNDLPNEKASNFTARLRETVQTMLGTRGDKLDRVVTLRDLIESGITKLAPGWRPGGAGAVPLLPGPSIPDPVEYVPDLTPPPTPTGFVVGAAISNIFVEHDAPLYPQGHGHLRTRLYGATHIAPAPLPTFNDAVEISQFSGTVHAHPTNPATTWRLWIKWETNDLVLSASPAGGTNGLEARTGEDVAQLLEALSAQITSSQLHADLSTPIASIPSLSAAAAANAAAIETIQTELADISSTPEYDPLVTYAVAAVVKYSGGLYRATVETTGNLPTNTAFWDKIGDYDSIGDAVAAHSVMLDDHETRITTNASGLSAEVTARSTLATQVRGGYTGTNVNALTTGLLFNERQARSSADATEVTARQLLSSRMLGTTDPSGATLANVTSGIIFDEKQTRATADTALTNQISVLSSTVNNNTAAISAEASTRASADSAQAGQITTIQSSLRNAPVLPSTFLAGLDDWTGSRGGAPATVATYDATVVTNDPDFGVCARITNMAPAGTNICTKGVLPCIPGRIYRVTSRFKVETMPTDGSFSMNTIIPHLSETYANATSTFSGAEATTVSAPGIYTTTAKISDVAAPGVYAWAAGSKYVRFGLRLNSNETGLVLRVQSILVEDVTDAQALSASIQTESTTRATQTGELYAQYTLKTDVGGLISGYGLASTANNAAPTSAFGVQAGQFFVAPPTVNQATAPTLNLYKGFVWRNSTTGLVQYYTGTAWSTTPQALPFIVQTAPTTINGATVPAGIYAENAFFGRLVATRGQIGLLAVDDARIANLSADKLTAGSIAVGQYIQGTGYIAGSAGWRINGNGTAEFSGVVVRGTVFATAGQIGGITIAANAVRAGQTAYNTGSGFHLGSDGRLSLGNSASNRLGFDGTNIEIVTPQFSVQSGAATFSGALQAASGSFSGNISGSTGSFSGTLVAGVLDVSQLVGQTTIRTVAGSYSAVVPAGFTQMRVTVVGGGGGGGNRGDFSLSGAGGGGGGGGTAIATFTVTPGQTVNYSVGAGGGAGGGGGTSIVNGYLLAAGGAPGAAGTGNSAGGPGGAGGAGGAGAVANGFAGTAGTAGAYDNQGKEGNFSYYGNAGTGGATRFGALGRGGDGGSTTTGTGGKRGSTGMVSIEFFNPNGVIIRSDWNTLISRLNSQGIATS